MPRELGTAGLGEGRLIGFNIKKGRLEVHPGQQVRKLHRFLLYHLHRIGRPRSDSWGGGGGEWYSSESYAHHRCWVGHIGPCPTPEGCPGPRTWSKLVSGPWSTTRRRRGSWGGGGMTSLRTMIPRRPCNGHVGAWPCTIGCYWARCRGVQDALCGGEGTPPERNRG